LLGAQQRQDGDGGRRCRDGDGHGRVERLCGAKEFGLGSIPGGSREAATVEYRGGAQATGG